MALISLVQLWRKVVFLNAATAQVCEFHTNYSSTGVGHKSKVVFWKKSSCWKHFEEIPGTPKKTHRVKYPWSLREVTSLPVKWQVYPWSTREVGTPKILDFVWWFFGWPIPHFGDCWVCFWSILACSQFLGATRNKTGKRDSKCPKLVSPIKK